MDLFPVRQWLCRECIELLRPMHQILSSDATISVSQNGILLAVICFANYLHISIDLLHNSIDLLSLATLHPIIFEISYDFTEYCTSWVWAITWTFKCSVGDCEAPIWNMICQCWRKNLSSLPKKTRNAKHRMPYRIPECIATCRELWIIPNCDLSPPREKKKRKPHLFPIACKLQTKWNLFEVVLIYFAWMKAINVCTFLPLWNPPQHALVLKQS